MTGLRYALAIAAGLSVMLLMGSAQAQENYDAGKTGAQLFASDCQLCHKQPEGLSKAGGIDGLEHFLSLHYTDSEQTAALLANYLKSVDRSAASGPPRSTHKLRSTRKHEDRAGVKAPAKGSESKPDSKHKPAPHAA